MTFDEYKMKVEESLIQRIGQKEALKTMDIYKEDLEEFYKDNWSVEAVATGMAMGM